MTKPSACNCCNASRTGIALVPKCAASSSITKRAPGLKAPLMMAVRSASSTASFLLRKTSVGRGSIRLPVSAVAIGKVWKETIKEYIIYHIFYLMLCQVGFPMKAIYLLPEQNFSLIYGPDEQREIAERVELVAPRQDAQSIGQPNAAFAAVEAIFSGWGMAKMDAAFFARFPNLKVLFYGAGAVDRFITEEVWARNVQISNANVANGTSVAEYTVAQ